MSEINSLDIEQLTIAVMGVSHEIRNLTFEVAKLTEMWNGEKNE